MYSSHPTRILRRMRLVERYDAFLLDLDGVLFRGTQQIAGAGEAVAALRSMGKGVAFLTNNASRTPEQVAAKLAAVGVEALPEEIETSARTTAAALAGRGILRAFVIGQEGVLAALDEVGIARVELDGAPEVVVVGLDRGVTYDRLRDAGIAVQRGARLVGTNGDTTFPAEDGLWPGAGALLAVVVATTGAAPEVFGKPAAVMFRGALVRAGGGRPLVVGDRLDTDIAGAAALGWDSLLVLSGVHARGDVAPGGPTPTFIADDVTGLLAERSSGGTGS